MSTFPDQTMEIVPILVATAGILTAGLSWPLVKGKIAPNPFYGIRTKRAFASEEHWYRVNKSGGKIFFNASVLITLVGLIGLPLPCAWLTIYSILATFIVLASVIGAGIIVLISL